MRKYLSLLPALALCLVASRASAQAVCVPTPGFVPGQIQPPPNVATFDDQHDVAWTGSHRQSFGSGAEEETAFRAVVDGSKNFLYVSWLVNVDLGQSTFENKKDGVSVGFALDNSGSGIVVNVPLPPGGALTDSQQQAPQILYYIPSPTTTKWATFTGTAAWATDSYFAIKPIATSTSKKWSIQMRIPLQAVAAGTAIDYSTQAANGIPYDNQTGVFSLFHRTTMHLPNNTVTFNVLPEGVLGSAPQGDEFALTRYPRPTDWVPFSVNTGSGCKAGFSLANVNIGQKNSTPTDPMSTIHAFSANTLVAYPHNEETAGGLSGNMKARWKLADWGSQYNDASWTFIGESTPQFVSASAKNPADPNNNASFGSIELQWTPDQGTICQYESAHYPLTAARYQTLPQTVPDPQIEGGLTKDVVNADIRKVKCGLDDAQPHWTKPGHQCMQVDIVSLDSVNFVNSSVTRNMDFVHNSVFQRDATIDIAGLKALAGQTSRDVYLYVSKLNMPAVATQSPPQPPAPLPNPPTCDGEDCCVDCGVSILATKAKANPTATAPAPNPQPRYYVNVFHDTGLFMIDAKGKKNRIVEKQSGFGYYPVHVDKPLYGWTDSLKGAKRITDNFYKLSIKNGGKAKVTTRIEALEQKPCDGGGDDDNKDNND